jgi:Domain of unknown function (DUF4349)
MRMKDTTHPVAPEEVMSFLDGELSADRSQSVSSHIEECFDCRKLRDSLSNTSRALAQWVVPASPVAAGVKNLLASSAFVASFTRPSQVGLSLPVSRRRAWAAVVASVILVVLALSFLPYRMMTDRPETEARPGRANVGNSQSADSSLDQFAKGSMGKLQVNILGTRTGKVKDVLEVEQEIARVRGEIEQMEAQQKNLEHRVDFATIELKLAEEYKAQLRTPVPSALIQLRNAAISGFRNAFGSVLALVLFLAESGPSLLLWLTLVGIPAWRLWRRYRRGQALLARA